MHVYPAILSDSVHEVTGQIEQASHLPGVKTVHIDVIDGAFVENVTVAPLDLADTAFTDLTVDFHLMVEEPIDYVLELAPIKDTLPIRAVIGQIERMSSQRFFVEEVRKQGWKSFLALDLFTPVEEIDEAAWTYLDGVLVLAVEAGRQGQVFHPVALDKVKELRRLSEAAHMPLEIIVDGGVDDGVLKHIHQAGADGIAVGSRLWRHEHPETFVQTAEQV